MDWQSVYDDVKLAENPYSNIVRIIYGSVDQYE